MEALKQFDIQDTSYQNLPIEQLIYTYLDTRDKVLFGWLCRFPNELTVWAYNHYDNLTPIHQLRFCRLLLHNRYHPKVAGLIVIILDGNTDEAIINALTPKPWVLKHKKVKYSYVYDLQGVASNAEYGLSFEIDDNFCPVVGEYEKSLGLTKKLWKRQYKLFCREYHKRINHYFKMMIRCEYIEYSDFVDKLHNDGFFAKIAHGLVFGVYVDNSLVDLVVVHDGVLCDIDNNPFDMSILENKQLAIVHPKSLPKKYDFLRYTSLIQPFSQLDRNIYSISSIDRTTGAVSRYIGTRIDKATMRQNSKGFGMIRQTQDSIYTKFDNIIARYTFSNIEIDGTVTLDKIIFYKSDNMVYLGLLPLFEKSQSCEPSAVPLSIFSEMLRVVGG
ncbi:MAG: DUF4132 domain-containing protein [Firmicutes bacterium]|nr:DUF4132 domain-containing protein [Bacillota bacterium]MCL1954227.1 DUF4132 domain-containing protein [Bacillota bacterium]